MQIVVLTDGLSTRAHPESPQAPPSLRLVNGRPLVDWQLDRFVASGARSVVMCVGHWGEQIETHVRRALDRGLVVSYSYDGEQPVGTGGTLRRAYARLEPEFVVTYGDCYLPLDYSAPLADLRAHPEADATMSVYRSQTAPGAGNVAVEGDFVTQYDPSRPDLACIDCGAIALRRSALREIEEGAVWALAALWRRLSRQRKLRAFMAPERGYDAGSALGLQALQGHLASETAP